jgi:hypothetical protein
LNVGIDAAHSLGQLIGGLVGASLIALIFKLLFGSIAKRRAADEKERLAIWAHKLGVSVESTSEEVEVTYLDKMQVYQPEKMMMLDPVKKQEAFLEATEIISAYEELKHHTHDRRKEPADVKNAAISVLKTYVPKSRNWLQSIGVSAIVLVGLGGVGGLVYLIETQPMDFQLEVDLSHEGFVQPGMKMEILINGSEAALSNDSISYTVRAQKFTAALLPKIEAREEYPCGWKDVPLVITTPSDSEIEEATRNNALILHLEVTLKEDGRVVVDIDNSGQSKRMLKLGNFEGLIEANSQDDKEVFVDRRCPEGTQLVMDGRVVAGFPSDLPKPAERETPEFLFDTTGHRCYTYEELAYSSNSLSGLLHEPPNTAHFELSAAYLHMLSRHIDYFLMDAPKEIYGMSTLGVVVRASLKETACPAHN